MENRKNNSFSLTKGKIVWLVCLVVFCLTFIFACMQSILPLGAGIVGTFGIMTYPVLILLALFSLAKFLGFSYRRSLKATILMTCFIISLLCVVHCIQTFKGLDAVTNGKTYVEYMRLSYEKLTVLGSFGSLFCGLFSLMFGGFTTIILFAILSTILIGLFIDFELYGKYDEKHIKKLRSRKLREKVSKSDEKAYDGKPNYSFSDKENEVSSYTQTDVAHEISSDVNEYTENSVQASYAEADIAHEIEENSASFEQDYAQENYMGYQNNIDDSYKNINFFGGVNTENNAVFERNGYPNYAQNNFVNEQQYSEAPVFSENVYEEEQVPNVFTDSMDEYRRKFIEDTFGMPSSMPNYGYENQSSVSYSDPVSPAYSQAVQPTFSQPSVSFENEPSHSSFSENQTSVAAWSAPQTPTYVGENFSNNENVNSGYESFNSNNSDLSQDKALGFESSQVPAFPGMIGNSIDDVKPESASFDAPVSDGISFSEPENFGVSEPVNNSLEDDIDNKISDIFNINEDDEDDSLVNSLPSNFNSETENSVSKSGSELTDFSFLRKDENDGLVSAEERVREDVEAFNTHIETTNTHTEPLFAENKVDSPNEGLIITSANPIEPPKVVVQAKEPQVKKFTGYNLGMNGIRYNPPPISLLVPGKPDNGDYTEEQERKSQMLEESLKAFNVPAKVVNIIRGPKITRYELSVPLGVPVKKIPMYELDIKRALAAKTINIQAPIPGSSYVGVELENDTFTSVSERELLESEAFQNCKDPLPIAIGKDISGEIVVKSLAKMVHLLIAGSTGSGKSVFIHSIVMSLLYKHSPEDLRLIMIDPKKVEFNRYNGLPHLLTPEVVMGSDKAINALKWCVKEMDRRYDLMSKSGYNNIEPYNRSELVKAGQFEKFPYIVIIVDELAELMMANKKEVEACIQRITQLARACGMHLILATQRPSVDIISGVIKNNVPSRIAFSLSSGIDSKTILNTVGAEKLLGQGDMLFSPNGTSSMPRLQAAYCSDEEIKAVIDFDKQNNSANYDDAVSSVINAEPQPEGEYAGQINDAPAPRELDSYFKTALKLVMQNGGASTSYLQRRLSIGYSRAAKIMDQMEDKGYIAPATGSKVRKVLITPEEFRDEFGEDFNDISSDF